jgi:hypothetical protein
MTKKAMHSARWRRLAGLGIPSAAVTLVLASCGGGGNPLGNPPLIANPPGTSGQKLSFAYFQKCINPIFSLQLQINQGGATSTNSCAGSGCHDNSTGTGGAFRVRPASDVDLSDPANTPDVVRASDMYKNYYSAQGEVIPGAPTQSRLLNKPLVRTVLHGGGLIFASDQDVNIKKIEYWVGRPAPQGQDEFSPAFDSMFTPPNPLTGQCNPP